MLAYDDVHVWVAAPRARADRLDLSRDSHMVSPVCVVLGIL